MTRDGPDPLAGSDSGDNQTPLAPDPAQIAIFADVALSWCDGFIPLRGIAEKGLSLQPKPYVEWCPADGRAAGAITAFCQRAVGSGHAAYVIPGTVAQKGQARADQIVEMQAVVVDLDDGDIAAKAQHLERHLGQPTLIVESGGRTEEGQAKLHLWWKLTEPAKGNDLAQLCRLRGEIAIKVGGDRHFASAHQPIRIPGSLYRKNGVNRLVNIRAQSGLECDFGEFCAAVEAMPPLGGITPAAEVFREKLGIDAVLTIPVREGGQDAWSRFEGASAAIGHFLRQVHEGRMTREQGWEAICGYNAAMLRPPWPIDRLKAETKALWDRHIENHGQPRPEPIGRKAVPAELEAYTLGELLDDTSPMPEDLISPRLLTPGGLLVLGGAPKIGKSDLLISLLVHMAAGKPFLGFTPPRPLRVFYLQAEIQYHYLRERVQKIGLPQELLAEARPQFVVTPKINMILDADGVTRVLVTVGRHFPNEPPDIFCADPIRNLFDGGQTGPGAASANENSNDAMIFFLRERVEALRDAINPDAGVILAHHTRKSTKQAVSEDPFQAFSGASALRGFYTSGLLLHRPDEASPTCRLEIELRNGPGLPAKVIQKIAGAWVEVDPAQERLVRAELGRKQDAERLRKHDVILRTLIEEASLGNLYSIMQFAENFENKAGLGSKHTIRERIGVLATHGHIKFLKDAGAFALPTLRSPTGYMVTEDMRFKPQEVTNPETGEIVEVAPQVLPSHYKCPKSGMIYDVENPSVWVYPNPQDIAEKTSQKLKFAGEE